MKSRLLLFLFFTFPTIVFGQNLIIQASVTDVTCNGGNNGEITLTITPFAPNAVGPYNVRLFYVDAFGGQTQLASHPSTASTSIVFKTGNGSLNVVGAESSGIPATGVGEFYRIDVTALGGSGTFFQKNKALPTITVSEPPSLAVSVNSLDSDCNAATGGANADGAIDITITGGTGSYNVSWPTTPPSTPISSTAVANGGTLVSSNLDGGSYTVTVTDANNCSITQNISLPISTAPNAGSDLALCSSTTTGLNANAPGSGETGTWSGPLGVSFTDVNSPTATVSGLSVGVNTLTWTITALGCSGSADQVDITVNPAPTPTFLAAATSVCEGSTGNVYTTEAGQSNYVWLVSGGGTITSGGSGTDNTVTITWSTIGPQTVSVNYQDALGCSSAVPTVSNVTVNALPTPTFTASPLSVCEGSTGNVYSTQAGQSNYVWSISGGGTITAGGSVTDNTVTVTWNTAGPQTVSVNYQDASGCTAVAPTTANVTVNTLPVATITSGPVAVCEGTAGNVYVTQAGQSNYVWSISGGGSITSGGSSTDNTVTVTWNTSGAQTVSVNYQDVSGCSSAVPALSNVTVNPTPTPTFIAAATSVCEGSTGNVYTTEAGQSNYVWLVSGGGTITSGGSGTDNTVTITWSTVGLQTVSVNYQDALGCSSAVPTVSNVTVNALPTPTFTASPLSVCEGSTGNVYSTQAGQSNYVWSISGGGTITAGGSVTDNTVTVTWNTAGPQTVSVNYQDASGCTAVAPTTANVTVNTLPVATITSGPVAVCEGTASNVYVTQLGQSNYVWSISGGGSITSGGSSTDNTVTVTWNTSGTQTVSVNYQDVSGCSSAVPALSNVTVNPTPTPTFIAAATSVCEGSTGNVYTTEAGQSNYVWLVSGGGTITSGGSGTDNTVTITWSTVGLQTVSVNYQDALGCSSAVPTVSNVTVNALPTPTFTASPLSVCEGSTGNVYSTQAGQSNYVWSISGGGTITAGGSVTDNTVTVTWNTAGPQTVSVNYQDASGCTAVAPTTANVIVNTLPVATITSGPLTVCEGTPGNIYTTQAGQLNYVWTVVGGTITAGGGSANNTATITWTASGAQTVSVNYQNAAGCSSALAAVANVTVNPLPTASISGTNAICAGSATTLTFNLSPGTFNVNYTDGTFTFTVLGITNGATVSVSPLVNRTYTITSVTNTATGCSVTAPSANLSGSAVITVSGTLPTASVSGTATICSGATTNLTFALPGGNFDVNYSDGTTTFTALGITNGATAGVSPLSNTTYTITSVTNTATGCSVTAPSPNISGNAVITVTGVLPTASISGSTTICAGASANITFTLSTGTFNVSYTDGTSNFTASGISNGAIVAVSPPVTSTYSITSVTDTSTGCSVTAPSGAISGSAMITVTGALPTASIGGSSTICSGSSVNLTFTLSPGTFDVNYSDGTTTFTALGITNGATVSVSPTTTTTYTIVSVTNTGTGCSVSAPSATISGNAVITVSGDLPTASINGNASICLGTPTNLTFALSPGTFNVSYSDGTNTFTAINVSNGATVSVNPAITSTYTITGVTNTTSLCSVSAPSPNITGSATITVSGTLPTAFISGSAIVCSGASTNLTFTLPLGTFDVNYSDGTTTFTLLGITNGTTVSVNPLVNTTYTIASVTNTTTGCSVNAPSPNISGSAVISVSGVAPIASIGGTTSICEGASTNLTFTLSTGTFNVSFSDGATTFNANGINNGAVVSVSPSSSTTYTILTVVNIASSCSVVAPSPNITGSAIITVGALPTASISGTATICSGSSTNLIFTLPTGSFDVVYTDGTTNFNASGILNGATVSVSPTINTTYSIVSVTNTTTGCSVTAPSLNITGGAVITVDPLPTASISGTATICSGTSTNLTFTLLAGNYDVVYTDGTTNFNASGILNGATVSVNPTINTTYSIVSVTNTTTGCSVTVPSPNITGGAVITVDPLPIASISGTAAICSGSSTNLTFTLPTGSYDVVYTDGTTNFNASGILNGATASVSPTINTTYSIVSVTNTTTGCSVTAPSPNITGSAVITVNPSPTATISGGGTVCAGGVLPNVVFTFTGAAPFSFTYTDGATTFTTTSAVTVFTITSAPAGIYSITALSDVNCPATSLGTPVSVIVDPLPIASISGTATICSGISTNLTFTLPTGSYDVVYTDGTTNFNASGILNGATASVSPTINTTYSIVSVTNTTTGCSVTAPSPNITGSAVITVNPSPTATISGGGTVCAGGVLPNVVFTFTGAAPFSFTYTDGATTFTTTSAVTVFTITSAPAGIYSITALSDVNCPATSLGTPVSVIVDPLPTASIIGTTAICSGISTNLTFTLPTGSYDVVYTDGTTNFNASGILNGATVSVNPTINTTYSIVSVTNTTTGCSVTAPSPNITGGAVITVDPLPIASISGTATICSGISTNLTFTLPTGSYDVVYTDGTTNFNASGILNGATASVSPTINTTYSIVSVTNTTTGCSVTAPSPNITGSAVITVNPSPTATISGGGTVCAGDVLPNVIFTFTGAAPFSFTYTDGTTTFTTTSAVTVFTITSAPAGIYSITALSDVNCPATSLGTPVSVIVDPLPTASISGTATICSGSSTNLTFTLPTGSYDVVYTDGTTNFNASGILNGATASVSPTINTTYTIVSVTNTTTGCSVTAPSANITGSAVITVNPSPTATVSGGGTVCAGGVLPNVIFTFTGAAPFSFTYTDGATTFTTTSAVTVFTITSAPAGIYSITALSDVNCPATSLGTPVSVIVDPLPTASISGTAAICSGISTNLTFTLPTGSYDVVYTDGTTNFNASGILNGATASVSPTINTTYSILSVTNTTTGCSVTAPSPNITGGAVITVDPLPTVSISGTATICSGSSTNLTFTLPTGSYDVVYTDGTTNFNASGILNGATASVSPTINTTYTIVSVTNTTTGCSVTAPSPNITGSAVISVKPPPTATISGGGTVCGGGVLPDVVFTFTGVAPFSFTYTDGTTPFTTTSSVPVFTIPNAAVGTYSITALSDVNCSATSLGTPVSVVVGTLPTASIGGTTTICSGVSTNLTFTLPTGSYDVVYTDGTTNFNASGILNGATASVSPTVNTTYSIVSVTNAATGCSVTAPSASITGSAVITVTPSPTATISGGGTVCGGGVLPDVVFTFTGVAPFSFTYTDGTTPFTTTSSVPVFTIPNAAVGTYSITALSDVNCSATSLGTPVSVVVGTLPTASIGGTTTICSGVSTNLTFTLPTGSYDVVYTDGTTNFNASGILNGATASVSPTVNTTYSIVSVTNAATGCSVTAPSASITGSAVITVTPSPTATISGGGTVCGGGVLPDVVFTFTGIAPFSFTYTDGTTTFAETSASTVFTITNAAVGTYSITALSDVNCSATSLGTPVSVVVGTFPTASLSGTATICSGISTNLTFTLPTGSYDVVYTDGTTNFNASGILNGATVSVNPTINTTYTIVSVTNSTTGCSVAAPSASITGSATITVLLATDPLCAGSCPTLTISNTTICPAGGNVDLTTLVSPSVAGGTFTFTGTGVTGNIFNPSGSAGTVVAIGVTYALSGCPNATGTINATVRLATDPLCSGGGTGCFAFTITVNTTRPSCSNQNDGSIVLNVSGVVSGNYIITLRGASFIATQVGPSGTYAFNNLSPDNYTYTVQDASGNICTQSFSLPVNSTVTANADEFTDAVCFGTATGSARLVSSGGTPPYEYSIDNGATWTIFSSPVRVNNLPPKGTYGILVRDGDKDTCPADVTVTINNKAAEIIAPLTTTNASCNNNDGSILVGTISGGTVPYAFKFDGVGIASLPANNTFAGLASGKHTLTVTDANGCSKDFESNITFPGLVDFSVSGSNSSCIALSNGSVTATIESVGSFQVGISNSQGVQPSTFFDVTSDGTTPFKFDKLAGGNYFVFVRSVGSACQNVKQQSITNSVSDISVSSTVSTACSGANGAITINSVGGGSASTYTYSLDGVSFISLPPSNTFTNLAGGDHIFRVTDAGGCFKDFKIVVPVPTAIDFTLVSEPLKCIEDKALIKVSNFKGASTDYTYQILQQSNVVSSGTISSVNAQQDFIIKDIILAQGNYQLQLQQNQVSINGCASPIISAKPFTISGPSKKLDTLYVIKNISLPDFATGSVAVGITESGKAPYEVRVDLVRPLFTSQGSLQDWTEATRNSENLRLEVHARSLFAGEYLLSVRDGFGCVKDFVFNLKADESIFIPNVITPNGDNFNDTFVIRNMPSATQVIIVNRWGREVYKSDDYKNDWDANDTSEGVYYYRIKAGEQVFTGWLEVLRDNK